MKRPLKIATFFNKLPYYSLFPKEADTIKEDVILRLLNQSENNIDMGLVDQISSIAAGLDIPPFVADLDRKCFYKYPCITHLLSAQEMKIELPSDIRFENLHQHLLDTIDHIRDLPGASDNLFLALWRFLPEKLAENDPCHIGKNWHLLPADPCIPSHTIWEHSAISSAIAGAYPEPNLLIFTIASAQELVTTARRTQDAWMGSFMLSYLSWQAVQVIVESCGPEALIFPSLRYQPMMDLWLHTEKGFTDIDINSPTFQAALEIGNIPNIFTAIVPGDIAVSLAEKADQAVRKAWKTISETVRTSIESTILEAWNVDISSWKSTWERQQDGFIDDAGIFWSVCPWRNDLNAIIEAAKQSAKQKQDTKTIDAFGCFISKIGAKYQTNVGMGYHLLSGFAAESLTARKNLRDFSNRPEPDHRCTLCGKWSTVHPHYSDLTGVSQVTNLIKDPKVQFHPEDEKNSYRWLLSFWQAFGQASKTRFLKLKGRIRKGERLCSSCLTRRLAMDAYFEKKISALDRHLFPSTAGISSARFRADIIRNYQKYPEEWSKILNNYVSLVHDFIQTNSLPYPAASVEYYWELTKQDQLAKTFLKIDGDWLFNATYDQQTLEAMYEIKRPGDISRCRDALTAMNRLAKKQKILLPSAYYAIIAMDGDKMGEWLTGRRAPLYDWLFHPDVRKDSLVYDIAPEDYSRPLGPALQLGLSDSLKNYALYVVRDIVEKQHPGKLIYAGGDDVLAFVPVEHLFEIMEKLYIYFQGKTNGFLADGDRLLRLMGGKLKGDEEHQGMSASMGVIILHHSYPLYHALDQAQEVLKKIAKEKIGRDAFAIRLMRRSGEYTETGFKYALSDIPCEILHYLSNILQLFFKGKLSSRLPYRMAEQQWAKGANSIVPDFIHEARKSELLRLVTQHTDKDENIQPNQQQVLELFDQINKYLETSTDAESELDILLYASSEQQKDNKTEKLKKDMDAWEITCQLLMILRFMSSRGE